MNNLKFSQQFLVIALSLALVGCSSTAVQPDSSNTGSSGGSLEQTNSFYEMEKTANAFCQQDQLDKAIETYRSWGDRHQNDMDKHQAVAFNDGLVKLLLRAGKPEQAEETAEKGLKSAERTYGPTSVNTQSAILTCLSVAEARRQREKSLRLLDRLVETCEKAQDPYRLMMALGQWESRISLTCGEVIDQKRLQTMYDLRKQLMGANHPATQSARLTMAKNLSNAKRFKESEQIYKAMLKDAESGSIPPNLQFIARSRYGKLLFQQGKEKEAEKLWKETLPLVQGKAVQISDYLEVLSDLGFMHYRNNRYAQAEPYYRQAVEALEKQQMYIGALPEEMFHKYISCLEQTGKSGEAKKLKDLLAEKTAAVSAPSS